jgi:hypothetical protein
LIGGLGQDALYGRNDDDILIHGTTEHDANDSALAAPLDEWNADRPFDLRAANLADGSGTPGDNLNTLHYLTAATVHDDDESDTLNGGVGQDWFFSEAEIDSVFDK